MAITETVKLEINGSIPESPHVRRTYRTASTPHRSGRAGLAPAARSEKVSADTCNWKKISS